MDKDAEHLRLLSIFHYVLGGLAMFFSCFFIFHIIFGLVMINAPASFWNHNGNHQAGPPAFFGWFFLVGGCFAIMFGWTLGGLLIYAGRCLNLRKRHLFCTVVAAVSCIMMPLGTVLGVFTIMVLQRPHVRELFGEPAAAS
jgi:hypothetical protein